MPAIMVPLSQEESGRLRDRAQDELRHPRDTARLLLRQALGFPPRELRADAQASAPMSPCTSRDAAHVSAS